ncbi:MAG: hypothetical protein R3F14_16535 [Polyangiaceae bacterium]
MSFNPYAPPEYNPDNFSGGGADGPAQAWGVEEVLRQSWEIVKQHWVALIFGPMIGGAIANVPAQLVSGAGTGSKKEETIIVLAIVGAVLSFFIQTYFTAGVIQMTLTAARGGVPQVMQVFQGGSAYGRLLGTSLLSGLAVLLGFILLIVPGIILGLGFSPGYYYAVDAGKGLIELARELNQTNGHKGQ